MPALECNLIPIDEMTPGQIGAIRNKVIAEVVKKASQELVLPPEKLIVRDIRPAADLALYAGGTTTSTVDRWVYDATTTTANAFTSICGSAQMGDQRYAAIFGVRDLRKSLGLHQTSMGGTGMTDMIGATSSVMPAAQVVSFIKLIVGGSDKVIWDLSSMQPYENLAAFTNSPVIIPQNTQYQIQYQFNMIIAGIRAYIQLIGVIVEPRGRTINA